MASIRALPGKGGKITSYEITVSDGKDINGKAKRHNITWKPEQGMTKRQVEKELHRFAQDFEDRIKRGEKANTKITFAEYAVNFMERKEKTLQHRTAESYRYLLQRINIAIGHIKLRNLRPEHIANFIDNLRESGVRQGQDRAITNKLVPLLKERKMSRAKLAQKAGLSEYTVDMAAHGKRIALLSAEKMARALDMPIEKLFTVCKNTKPLSEKTVLEYYTLIHTMLKDAYKNGYIDYNAADRVDRPKAASGEVECLQPEDVSAILKALDNEGIPLKWRLITHLLIITGCRRGEIAGLRWNKIDWDKNRLIIDNTLLYSSERGLYASQTKTQKPRRITVPAETMALLQEYHEWYSSEKASYGELWQRATSEDKKEYERKWRGSDYLFVQEGGWPMHPDSINAWLDAFAKEHSLPQLNPHKFRHTQASLLIYSGADIVSVSKRLGHAKTSTTTDIYAHIIDDADERNAESIADVILRNG